MACGGSTGFGGIERMHRSLTLPLDAGALMSGIGEKRIVDDDDTTETPPIQLQERIAATASGSERYSK